MLRSMIGIRGKRTLKKKTLVKKTSVDRKDQKARKTMADKEPVVSTFPSAGTRTARIDLNAVEDLKNSSGEFLHYHLVVEGGQPAFAFGCKHPPNKLTEQSFPGGPKKVYDWDWGKNSGEIHSPDDVYVLALSFGGVTKYTLVIDRRAKDGSVLETVRDVDDESQVPTDKIREPLRVFSS